MKVLVLFDPKTSDLRGVLSPQGEQTADEVNRYFDPPDHYWETLAQTTLEQKVSTVSWEDFAEQLSDRPPYMAWWQWADVDTLDLPSAFAELLERVSS